MKRGTPFHPKMHDLAQRLKVPLYSAVGIMEMLWHCAANYTPQGNIGGLTDESIAHHVAWNKKPSVLVNALVESGWLDLHPEYRLIVHDWDEHVDNATRKRLMRAGQTFLPVYAQISPAIASPESPPIGLHSGAARPPNGVHSAPDRQPTRGALAMAMEDSKKKTSSSEFDAEERFQAYRARHPGSKTRIGDCRSAYINLLVTAVDSLETADSMDRIQSKWIEYWNATRAIPLGLFNFLVGGDCLSEPPEVTALSPEKSMYTLAAEIRKEMGQ